MIVAAVTDLSLECKCLADLLELLPETASRTPTAFKNWSPYDVLGHLHLFDVAAKLSITNEVGMRALFTQIQESRSRGLSLVEVTANWLGHCSWDALLNRWRSTTEELQQLFLTLDAKDRLPWGGPDMSARSLVSARQMETWAHGQAIFDLCQTARQETDRIRNIVIIGINTFNWSFLNRGLPVPEAQVRLELILPSGKREVWSEAEAKNAVVGSAVEFCQVVTQTRNVVDTQLQVNGEVASEWMAIAQCFAGPPESPPRPGTRI